jgi:2-amino-4-hydroxy-6-hydroxymethyldihydropteridine diphosphokinase
MTTAVLSVGSNLGDRLAAPVYETAPWGPVPQDDFLNAVLVAADAAADPRDWLARAQAAEQAAGRTRETRWGPRTLDVDVVAVDDIASADPALTLPHPRAAERAFVLVPWLAVQPEARLAQRPVRDLVAALPAEDVAGVRARPDLVVG